MNHARQRPGIPDAGPLLFRVKSPHRFAITQGVDGRERAMIYASGADFRAAREKRVLLFGMSGLGKT
ncbi:MAG: hypothetical protein O9292_08680, partial [Rhodobacteraceae bacterium]|nr:hypothetical protein [Paracoccaceae bacterium]